MKCLIVIFLFCASVAQAGWLSDMWTKTFGTTAAPLPKFGTCMISLSKKAPKGGMAFNINTSNAIVTTPARVSVPSVGPTPPLPI